MNKPTDKIGAVFQKLNREIWLVSSAAGDRRGGLVATWVSQASLEESDPLVVIALARRHFTAELVSAGNCFALHLITADQIALAWRFALGSGRDTDKLSGIDCHCAESGAPVLAKCLAWLDCRVIHQYAAADRLIFWGAVVGGGTRGEGEPLREQELFAAATPDQSRALRQSLVQDIELHRPLIAAWKEQIKQRTSE